MKKEIRDRRNKLCIQSKKLRQISINFDGDKAFEIRKKQDEIYKRWQFYDNLIKKMEQN